MKKEIKTNVTAKEMIELMGQATDGFYVRNSDHFKHYSDVLITDSEIIFTDKYEELHIKLTDINTELLNYAVETEHFGGSAYFDCKFELKSITIHFNVTAIDEELTKEQFNEIVNLQTYPKLFISSADSGSVNINASGTIAVNDEGLFINSGMIFIDENEIEGYYNKSSNRTGNIELLVSFNSGMPDLEITLM